jgi:hypothetical protein
MRSLRFPLTALFLVLVLVDVVVGYKLWAFGWPTQINLTSSQTGVERAHVTAIPFTGSDYLIVALIIAVHAVLLYTMWKAWHPFSVRA